MATVTLGSIKFNWKGAYNSSTAYAVDDVVSSGGNSYVCIQAHTNQAVGNATAYWNIMSSKGTDADLLNISSTAQGDIYYNSGSAIARLGAGTSGQVLQTGGTGANPSWVDSSGGILQVIQSLKTNTQSFSGLSTTFSDITGLSVTITPASSSSKFLIMSSVYVGNQGNPSQSRIMRGTTPIFIGDAASSRKQASTQYHSAADNLEGQHHSYSFLDSPATSSAITYKPQLSIGGSATHYVNRVSRDNDAAAEDARMASSFIVMEVGV